MSHGGGHGHQHMQADSAMLGTERGVWALKVSFAGLLVTAAIQASIYLFSGSAALLADTLHNVADACTSLPLWFAFWLSRRQATRRFSYGLHRSEDLAGVLIILVILGSAALAAFESIQKLLSGEAPHNLGWVIAAGVIGLIGNEIIAQFRIRVGKQIGSAALVADGQHARTDGIASAGVIIGASGALLGFPLLDPLVGLGISALIVYAVYDSAKQIGSRLLDAIEPATLDAIAHVAADVAGVRRVGEVRARWLGHQVLAELRVVVDGATPTAESHRIAEDVRHDLLHHVRNLGQVIVHIDPDLPGDEAHPHTDHDGPTARPHTHDEHGHCRPSPRPRSGHDGSGAGGGPAAG